MSAYHICLVQPPGYAHAAAFAEVADTIEYALRRLGHGVTRSAAAGGAGARTIVLGSNLLAHAALTLPADAILYNLEQLDASSSWLTPPLLDLFRRHTVWDYSVRNAVRYAALGLPTPRVVPIGWVPELERVPRAEEDIDVLFYGSLNERRSTALDAVRAVGLRVETAFGVYGAERDGLIARAKVVLNVHFYQAKVLELVRLSYLLGNRRCVVSERGADEAEARALERGVAFAAYEHLAATCARLAGDPVARRELGEAGHTLMASRDATAILAEALSAPPPPALSDEGSRPLEIAGVPVPAYYHFARPEVVALAQPRGRRVLDVGCAAGAMGAAMLAQGAEEVVGVEVHAGAASRARGRLTAVYRLDIESLPELPYPERYFDVITLADVLEHLRDPVAVLRHLGRWLAPDGRVVCSLPNVRHQSVLLPLLLEGRWDYQDAGVLDRTHLRFFTPATAVSLLADAGLVVAGPVQAVVTPPARELEAAARMVAALGYDAARFTSEARIVQVLLSAGLSRASNAASEALLDPWRGSRPTRILLAPDATRLDDCWRDAMAALAPAAAANPDVTLGIALPLESLATAPAELAAASGDFEGECDLLLIEAPTSVPAWERLLAGASLWVRTSPRPNVEAAAQRVGVEIRDLARAVAAAA
jgi:2-polyprenyl-3-methyl-5-hydroxy-6-metoxy-1,4-benzoquinol methylase